MCELFKLASPFFHKNINEVIIQQKFPILEYLASTVRYPHYPSAFENVLRMKFTGDPTIAGHNDQVMTVFN